MEMTSMTSSMIERATVRDKGYWYEDFVPGLELRHHWGRTITQSDNTLFSTLTLHFNPHYTNAQFAAAMGHRDTPVNPLLVFNTVFGLSVQDLSEHGTAFLGVEELRYQATVYPGDTIYARSTVTGRRVSSSNPKLGIASWHTRGYNQRDELVCEFKRSNLIFRRELASQGGAA
jgi:acyl dehydratase